jgi:hypothetical protein
MKVKLNIIKENKINEAHGLSGSDAKKLKDFAKSVEDAEIKRILNFIIKSNVKVDKTQDVTKMKKPKDKEKES